MPPQPDDIHKKFLKCCKSGQIDKLGTILEENPEINIHIQSEKAFRLSCENVHLNIAKYLWNHALKRNRKINVQCRNNICIRNLAKNGTVDFLNFIYSCDSNLRYNVNAAEPFRTACSFGRLDLAETIYEWHQCGDSTLSNEMMSDAIFKSSGRGFEDVVRKILEWAPRCLKKNNHEKQSAVLAACKYNKINILRILYEASIQYGFPFTKAILISARYGNLEIMNQLWEWMENDDKESVIENYEEIVSKVCEKGQLGTLQQLFMWNHSMIVQPYFDTCFAIGCENNHLELAQYLYSINPRVDIHYNDEEPFRMACYYGNMEVLEQLVEWGNMMQYPIDIHANNDEAFKLACSNYQMHIINKLFELSIMSPQKIDFSHDNYVVISELLTDNKFDIARKLFQLDPRQTLTGLVIHSYKIPLNAEKVFVEKSLEVYNVFRDLSEEIIKNLPLWIRKIYLKNRLKMALSELPEDKNPVECLVCKDKMTTNVTLCKHQFCMECLEQWIKKSSTCPYCRSNLAGKTIVKDYYFSDDDDSDFMSDDDVEGE